MSKERNEKELYPQPPLEERPRKAERKIEKDTKEIYLRSIEHHMRENNRLLRHTVSMMVVLCCFFTFLIIGGIWLGMKLSTTLKKVENIEITIEDDLNKIDFDQLDDTIGNLNSAVGTLNQLIDEFTDGEGTLVDNISSKLVDTISDTVMGSIFGSSDSE